MVRRRLDDSHRPESVGRRAGLERALLWGRVGRGPAVSVLQRDLDARLLELVALGPVPVVLEVAEPAVLHELDPRGGQYVERSGRDELIAREQLAADRARVRLHELVGRVRVAAVERHVAAHARAPC